MKKLAHLSFDDVFSSIYWLYINRPTSIFDMVFYGTLRRLHLDYGAVFSLYAFLGSKVFSIEMIPDEYCHEFYEASEWLRFGYHADTPGKPILDYDISAFKNSLLLFDRAMCRLTPANRICKCTRLHDWSASSEQIAVMKSLGATSLLCRDNEGLSYDLTPDECVILNTAGFYEKNNMGYRRTDIRFDNCKNINTLLAPVIETDKEEIVLFGHEQWFSNSIDAIEGSIAQLYKNEYAFFAE